MIDLDNIINPRNAAISLYLIFVVIEMVYAAYSKKLNIHPLDTVSSMVMGLGSTIIGLFVGGLFVYLSFLVWDNLKLFDLGASLWVFLIAFVIYDFVYYWIHRFGHTVRWMWAAHVVHHSSQYYNLSTALRQTWTSAITPGFLLGWPMIIIGIHPAIIMFVSGLNLVYQFWIHTEAINKMPKWFESIMNTPSHHRVHHAVNPRYLDRNYAGVFIVWDKLFNTFEAENVEKPQYGIINNLTTFNPLRIAFHEWHSLVKDMVRSKNPINALKFLFKPPGWTPDNSRKTSQQIRQKWLSDSHHRKDNL